MSKVILYIAVSIDGYIARTNGAVDWLDAAAAEEDDYGYEDFYKSVDALIMGRKTYEEVLVLSPGEWPYAGKLSYVLSSQDIKTGSDEIRVSAKRAEAVVADLKACGMETIWLLGGGELTASLLTLGLIDEMILSVIPLTLGVGVPLFPQEGEKDSVFSLLNTRGYETGVVQLHYRLVDQ